MCGHNTVIYNTENKSYRFIQGKSLFPSPECAFITILNLVSFSLHTIGVEGTEGVTCMAVSDNKKFLAICERSQQAVCFVYEVASLKRRRIITSSESIAKEFIDVRFAHSEDKMTNFMLTLVSRIILAQQLFVTHKSNCLLFLLIDWRTRLQISSLAMGQAKVYRPTKVRPRCAPQGLYSNASVLQSSLVDRCLTPWSSSSSRQ